LGREGEREREKKEGIRGEGCGSVVHIKLTQGKMRR